MRDDDAESSLHLCSQQRPAFGLRFVVTVGMTLTVLLVANWTRLFDPLFPLIKEAERPRFSIDQAKQGDSRSMKSRSTK